MIQRWLECEDKLLGNQQIFVFLAIEHLLGIRSNVEVHYQLFCIEGHGQGAAGDGLSGYEEPDTKFYVNILIRLQKESSEKEEKGLH